MHITNENPLRGCYEVIFVTHGDELTLLQLP
jgi:hypothetical protein